MHVYIATVLGQSGTRYVYYTSIKRYVRRCVCIRSKRNDYNLYYRRMHTLVVYARSYIADTLRFGVLLKSGRASKLDSVRECVVAGLWGIYRVFWLTKKAAGTMR